MSTTVVFGGGSGVRDANVLHSMDKRWGRPGKEAGALTLMTKGKHTQFNDSV